MILQDGNISESGHFGMDLAEPGTVVTVFAQVNHTGLITVVGSASETILETQMKRQQRTAQYLCSNYLRRRKKKLKKQMSSTDSV
jgi:hypothetical protein